MEHLPTGALLKDPRNRDALNLRVVSADAEHVVVSTGTETRRYIRKGAALRRWLLPPRTAVAVAALATELGPRAGIVLGVHRDATPTELWTYEVKTETGTEWLSEQSLRVLAISTDDPVMRLEVNGWRGPRRFFARLGLLERTTTWKRDSEGIPAFLGARIEPLFHQFYAARRCLLDREPRFLLADEVGLGKTIEAGLVIQSLLASKPNLRVLVVAPGTTSRQWLSELYSRFGGRVFTHVDAVRYEPGARTRKAMDALLKSDRLIVTTSLLRSQAKALSTVTSQHWDLLVVDEGHHLVNWPDLAVPLRKISLGAEGCLVLTATPGRGDDKGLLELLKLVAPATYESVTESDFEKRLEPQQKIIEKLLFSEQLVEALLAQGEIGEGDARELAEHWKGLFPDDAIVAERLARMEEGDGEAAEQLVAHIQENYRVDRRIIRTRRKTLGEYGSKYAPRAFEHLEYDACPAEVAVVELVAELVGRSDVPATWKAFWSRQSCTTPRLLLQLLEARIAAIDGRKPEGSNTDPLASDLGPAEEEAAFKEHIARGPRFPSEKIWLQETLAQAERWNRSEPHAPGRFVLLCNWLKRRIRSGINKTLVFSQSRAVIEELAAYLRTQMDSDAVTFITHELRDEELAEVCRDFERRPKTQVLLSDEVGAEGRNFQFADAVVHLDQPDVVARLEQRIGRLDRIGRGADRPVRSFAITGPSELERSFLELHREVFRVYECSIGGLEYLLPRFQQQIRDAAEFGAIALRRLAADLKPRIEAEEQRIDEAFSFFLDATRPELERAKALAELVAERTGNEDESFVREWCKELRIDLLPQREDMCVKVEVRTERLDAPLPALGGGDWVKSGTFARSTALDKPALQYFAPGHLFIDALLQSAHETHDARASVFFRDLGAKARGRVFILVVSRLEPDEGAWREGLSAGLLRRAEHYLAVEWVRTVFEMNSDGEVVLLPPGAVSDELRQDFKPTDRKCHPDDIAPVVERFPGLWVGLHAAVTATRDAVLAEKRAEVDAAADELEDALRFELAYLRSQVAGRSTNDSGTALRERESLLASVRSPRVMTDAVAIVFGGGGR